MAPTLRNEAIAVYALYGVRYGLSLVLLPYLTHVLGPEGWGALGFAYGLSAYLIVVMEYGFALSGTRDVAAHRDDPKRLRQVVQGVAGAKGVLVPGLVGMAGLGYVLAPVGLDDAWIWAGAVVFSVTIGADWNWFFLGMAKARLMVTLEIAGRLAALLAVVLLVKEPAHAPRVLFLQAAGGALVWGLGFIVVHRTVGRLWWRPHEVANALKQGWSLFVFRGMSTVYAVGNPLLLGWLVSPEAIGWYVGAERLVRMASAFHQPMSRVLFPRQVRAEADGPLRMRGVLLGYVGVGGLLTVGLALGARWLVDVVMGPGYEEAVSLLRVLAFVPLLVAVSQALGVQWMLPTRQDGPFLRIICAAAVLNVLVVVLSVPVWGVLAAAWAVVIIEAFVAISMAVRFFRLRRTPFRSIPSNAVTR